jgi:chromosome partitioning protein
LKNVDRSAAFEDIRRSIVSKKQNIFVIAHRKGGVGKTTTTISLATGVAGLAHPVVTIDLDAQGNLGQFLGLGRQPHTYDLLMYRDPGRFLGDLLTPVSNYPTMRAVLGDDTTREAERALGDPHSSRPLAMALGNAIEAIQEGISLNGHPPYVFLDTPPGLGPLQLAALVVADYLIIPVNPAFASETGIPRIAQQIAAIREQSGRGAQLLAILPTRYRQQTLEHQEVVKGLRKTFGEKIVYPPVRETVRLEEAPGRGLPIWDYDPKGIGARDYARVLVQFIRDAGIPLPNGNGNRRNGRAK